jgi:hypothetical protein
MESVIRPLQGRLANECRATETVARFAPAIHARSVESAAFLGTILTQELAELTDELTE